MFDIKILKYRKEPVKNTKIIIKDSNSNVVNSKKEKAYDYYICDYCRDEIRLDLQEKKRRTNNIPSYFNKVWRIKISTMQQMLK